MSKIYIGFIPSWIDVGASYGAFQMNGSPASAAVPEIDPAGMGSVLALLTGAIGLLEQRRRLKTA